MRKIFTFLFAALMSVASMWAQTETLLTTITATGIEQASYSTANVATVSFSYTAGGSSAYVAMWGWWGYGWSATVNAAEGYTITRCVFYDDTDHTATDSNAPFVVETTEEDKTPKVNGTPITQFDSRGIKKIDVYGYATPEPEPAGEVTVVFAANNKTVERTVTLPHTFKCDWAAGMDEPDELDIIIHELYNDYYYCNNNIQASGSDQVEVGTEEDPQNDYITIKGVFEGTATVTGDYFDWITGEEGAHNYSITISIKGDAPEPAKYYVVGNMTEWAVDENYEMNPNIYAETEEYFYALDLTTTSEFKVVKVEGENQTWYPTGMGNNYGENGEITEDAEYTIYFRPNYDGGEDWFYNCIYVSKNEPEPAEVTVVFAANNNTVEKTVTLPHTFSCSYENKDGELDAIIKELYEISAGHCSDDNYPVASGNEAVLAGSNGFDNYITISAAFEGTATVSGVYWNWDAYDGDGDWMDYTLTISIKGDATAIDNTPSLQGRSGEASKILRDGQLLIERDGKIFNLTGAQVR